MITAQQATELRRSPLDSVTRHASNVERKVRLAASQGLSRTRSPQLPGESVMPVRRYLSEHGFRLGECVRLDGELGVKYWFNVIWG